MDKTKKYQIGSLAFTRAEVAWVSDGWNASVINDKAMERFISDGIATEVKEKLKGSVIVSVARDGYVHSHTTTHLAMLDLSMEFGNILRSAFGGCS